jgi:hypothetical protein
MNHLLREDHMKMRLGAVSAVFILCAFAGLSAICNAAIVTYSGQDDGAPVTGPFPNSAVAQFSFTTAAGSLGAIHTITFEDQPVGFNASFLAAPGVTATLNAIDQGNGLSGISDGNIIGSIYGFNTTPSGRNWLGFAGGSAIFDFTVPVQSFGVYLTGLQTTYTSSLTIAFTDNQSEVLNLPVNVSGGAQYFGFTDAGASITRIQIANISNDGWGIDDITFTPVPEPGTMLILSSGLLGLLVFRNRPRNQ